MGEWGSGVKAPTSDSAAELAGHGVAATVEAAEAAGGHGEVAKAPCPSGTGGRQSRSCR